MSALVTSTVSEIVNVIEKSTTRSIIGAGSYGTVYSVTNGSTYWAEKEMKLFTSSSELNALNLREANYHKYGPKTKNLINTTSVSIKTISNDCDCGICVGNVAIVVSMPLGKTTLDKYISKTTAQDRRPYFRRVFAQICLGIAPIHSGGMVHIDLKPYNALIDPQNLEVTVIDLGGIRFEYNETTKYTSTIVYRAPELFDSYSQHLHPTEKFGPHNDVWSLGIMMLEYLTGKNILLQFYGDEDITGAFVNREKPYPVRKTMMKYGINPDLCEFTRLIERMLTRSITERISLAEVYSILTGGEKIKMDMFRTKTQVSKIPVKELCIVSSNERTATIQRLHKKMEDTQESIQYAFELAVSLADRYSIKKLEIDIGADYVYTDDLLQACLFISTSFLTDDCENGEWCSLIIGETTLPQEVKALIVNIVSVLDFDIYRPTFHSYLQKFRRISEVDREVIFEMMGNVQNYGKTNEELFIEFNLLLSERCPTPTDSIDEVVESIETTTYKENSMYDEFNIPKDFYQILDPRERHSKIVRFMMDYVLTNSCIQHQVRTLKIAIDYIAENNVLNVLNNSNFNKTLYDRLMSLKNKNIPGPYNPTEWAPTVITKLFPDVMMY